MGNSNILAFVDGVSFDRLLEQKRTERDGHCYGNGDRQSRRKQVNIG
ncbi:hypothetical protein QF028_000146 [Neobacillus sp. B4I6]